MIVLRHRRLARHRRGHRARGGRAQGTTSRSPIAATRPKAARGGRPRPQAIRPGARRARAYRLDVRSSAEVEAVGDRCSTTSTPSTWWSTTPASTATTWSVSMSDEEWREVIATNLTGAFYVCRQFLPTMLAQPLRPHHQHLVDRAHAASPARPTTPRARPACSACRRRSAKEYGRKGITGNVVVPGFFDTDMTREGMSEANKSFWLKYCPVGPHGRARRGRQGRHLPRLRRRRASSTAQSIAVTGGLDWAP